MSGRILESARSRGQAGRVAIAGAGIAGLVLATRLAQDGREVTVFEARGEAGLKTEGLFLTLAPNGMNGLRSIGLSAAVAAKGIATRAIEILDERGRRLAIIDQNDFAATLGAEAVTIRRGALADLLLAGAREAGADVRLATAVVEIEQLSDGVTVTTDDGERGRFAVLAACDGLRSKVRPLVFPEFPHPRFTGLIGTGGFVDAPMVAATGGTMTMTFGRDAFFGYIKASDGPVFWFNSYAADGENERPSSPSAYAAFLRELHSSDPQPNRDIISRVEAIERGYPIYDMPELPTWHRGDVVLVGDAGHAVGPHAGQGASMAIEDALVLAACLKRVERPAMAFRRYEALRRDRVREVVKLTARNGSQKRSQGWLSLKLRNLILPIVIPLSMRTARRICAYRVDRDPALAEAAAGA
jgi:2-polyprenyl-6-methoxyphenol hydroxylase-like FAD-dependent oxidoreductase